MKGFPMQKTAAVKDLQPGVEGKDKMPHNTQLEVKRGKVDSDHAEKKHGPAKHTRRREGHMETYGAGHTNADHPDYWKKDETGVTPKSKEVAADKKTTDKKSKTGSTDKSKKNIGEKVVGVLKSKFQAWKEGQKKRVAAGPKPKPGDKKYKWSPSGGWKAGGKEKYEADLAAYNEKLKK